MDQLDRDIIDQLRANGRLTNTELARRIDLSPSPTLRRVRQLEASGVISGYRAVVDPAAMGRGFEVLVSINLQVTGRDDIERFEAAVGDIDEVVEAHRLYGEPDYLLRVAVEDNSAYERLYSTSLTALPCVAKAWSQMMMKQIK